MDDTDPCAVTRGQRAVVPPPCAQLYAPDGSGARDILPTPVTASRAEGQDEAEIRFFS